MHTQKHFIHSFLLVLHIVGVSYHPWSCTIIIPSYVLAGHPRYTSTHTQYYKSVMQDVLCSASVVPAELWSITVVPGTSTLLSTSTVTETSPGSSDCSKSSKNCPPLWLTVQRRILDGTSQSQNSSTRTMLSEWCTRTNPRRFLLRCLLYTSRMMDDTVVSGLRLCTK